MDLRYPTGGRRVTLGRFRNDNKIADFLSSMRPAPRDMLHFASNWIAIGLRRDASRSQRIDTVGTPHGPRKSAVSCSQRFFCGCLTCSAACVGELHNRLELDKLRHRRPQSLHRGPIGTGPGTPSPYNVLLDQGAQIWVIDKNAITLGDNATITLNPGAVVQTTTTTSDGNQGRTIEAGTPSKSITTERSR